MSKYVTFYLGPAIGLSSRRLTIHPLVVTADKANVLTPPAAVYVGTLAGTDTYTSVSLPDNRVYQAQLRDYKTTGEQSKTAVLNFSTSGNQFPGPSRGRLSVYSMDDESSSSSVSSSASSSSRSSHSHSSISTSSSSSSVSSSSKSSSSPSSLSQSSASSISTSSSSISTSSSSKSSQSASSKSSISTSSSSSSSSSSGV